MTQYDKVRLRHCQLHLKKYSTIGECFRIGGDEFCVLAPDIREERFEEICQNFRAALEKEDQETTYPFSASMGYVLLDESGIDECVKKADQKMYEENVKGRGTSLKMQLNGW